MERIPRALTGVFLLAFVAAGCGKNEEKLAQVQGKVYYRGVPLHGGCIVFIPDADRGGSGPEAWAEIRPDGSYSLRSENGAGIGPGWHRVTIAGETSESLPGKYSEPDLSGECHEVKPGIVNIIDLRLD